MEIIISNKQLLELAKINKAKTIESFAYNGNSKYRFISLNKDQLVKSILYIDQNNNYILEIRR